MNYTYAIWSQLKNKTPDDLVRCLLKDGWKKDITKGAKQIYRHPESRRRVSIHYHPNKTYGASLLKGLLNDIGWSVEEMRKLKLIK